MKECIAENRYTLTKELFDEGMKRVSQGKDAPLIRKTVLWISAAWLVMTAAAVILNQNLLFILFETLMIVLIILWLTIFLPGRKRRTVYRRLEEQYGSEMERTTRIYTDEIIVNAAGREIRFPNNDIEKILETGRLLILLTSGSTGILLAKDGFIRGSEAAVRELFAQSVK